MGQSASAPAAQFRWLDDASTLIGSLCVPAKAKTGEQIDQQQKDTNHFTRGNR